MGKTDTILVVGPHALKHKGVVITECHMGVRQAVQQLKRIGGEDSGVIDIGDEFRDGDVCCWCVALGH